MTISSHPSSHLGFTLLELLIVIGVLGILATALILVLNPLEFFKQSRDARRITDLKAINSALGIATIEGLPLGTAGTVYVSIPDTSATCANLGLPALPTGYVYACSTETNYMKANGTGWIPVNLTALSTRSPLSRLPTDPVNTTSTGYYYTYIMGGSYALTSTLESDKLLKQTALNDGGYDPGRYEVGSDLKLVARQEGLAGWWTFDEGSGTTAGDGSGNGNTGTLTGGPSWEGGCKVGECVNFLTGQTQYISFPASILNLGTSDFTIAHWVNITQPITNGSGIFGCYPHNTSYNGSFVEGILGDGVTLFMHYRDLSGAVHSLFANYNSYLSSWAHVIWVKSGTRNMELYINGQLAQTVTIAANFNLVVPAVCSGQRLSNAHWAPGIMAMKVDEFRIYRRALSAAEIQAMYNATK